jgi:hypothetical protein
MKVCQLLRYLHLKVAENTAFKYTSSIRTTTINNFTQRWQRFSPLNHSKQKHRHFSIFRRTSSIRLCNPGQTSYSRPRIHLSLISNLQTYFLHWHIVKLIWLNTNPSHTMQLLISKMLITNASMHINHLIKVKKD